MFYLAIFLMVIAVISFVYNGYIEKSEEKRKTNLKELNDQINRYNRTENEEWEIYINGCKQEEWHPDQPI